MSNKKIFYLLISNKIRKCHFVATVDKNVTIFKYYSFIKKEWVYSAEYEYLIEYQIDILKKIK